MLTAKKKRERTHPAAVYATQNLRRLLQHLSGRPKPSLLDIGFLTGSNIQWLIRRGYKTQVEDCFQSLKRTASPSTLLKDTLQQYPAYFDAVLCWDLLDYLSLKQACELVGAIGSLLKPRGLIFAFFNFNQSPLSPSTRYRIIDETHLEYLPCPETLPYRRIHQNRDIQEIFSGFEVVNSCLLMNQMREILIEKAS